MRIAVLSIVSLLWLVLVAPAPTQAAASGDRRVVGSESMSCRGQFASGDATIGFRSSMPREVAVGKTTPAADATVTFAVPQALLARMRESGVTSVRGVIAGTAIHLTAKIDRIPFRKVRIPATRVPDSGPMVLVGTGRRSAFKVAEKGNFALTLTESAIVRLQTTLQGRTIRESLSCDAQPIKRAGSLRVR
ncbi:DUF6801 domain-containing protein [Nocardioides sp. R-C-SC26]|uniref:DUF6801 domain-containing protein n=1 Tax=Nocardioides sp. R-C-SC26 TaxID=2870414 RepID=UPI001E6339EE|nr:DUF6801 domain-containing protein [Nocardioides sp. R-C-SC26]